MSSCLWQDSWTFDACCKCSVLLITFSPIVHVAKKNQAKRITPVHFALVWSLLRFSHDIFDVPPSLAFCVENPPVTGWFFSLTTDQWCGKCFHRIILGLHWRKHKRPSYWLLVKEIHRFDAPHKGGQCGNCYVMTSYTQIHTHTHTFMVSECIFEIVWKNEPSCWFHNKRLSWHGSFSAYANKKAKTRSGIWDMGCLLSLCPMPLWPPDWPLPQLSANRPTDWVTDKLLICPFIVPSIRLAGIEEIAKI